MNILDKIIELGNAYSEAVCSKTIRESTSAMNNYKSLASKIENDIVYKEHDFQNCVPILTPSEIINHLSEDYIMSDDEKEWNDNYKRTLFLGRGGNDNYKKRLQEAYDLNKNGKISDDALVAIGWLPNVPVCESTFNLGRRKLKDYANDNLPLIINLEESTKNKILKVAIGDNDISAPGNLKPIYLVTVNTATTMGALQTDIGGSSIATHCAIGFDHNLDKLYSYNMNAKYQGGLSFESIKGYYDDSHASTMKVLTIFVKPDHYETIVNTIYWYIDNWRTSKFSMSNILNMTIGDIDNSNPRYELSVMCAQFIDSLLKLINLNITGKRSSDVTPADFYHIKNNTVYTVYNGFISDYEPAKIKDILDSLAVNALKCRNTIYESHDGYNDDVINSLLEMVDSIVIPKPIYE